MMKKIILILFMVFTFCATVNAGINLVDDGNGCYYWNGDRNYLAFMTYRPGVGTILCVKLNTARMNSDDTVTAEVVEVWDEDSYNSALGSLPKWFYRDGSFAMYGSSKHYYCNIGNRYSVANSIFNAAR